MLKILVGIFFIVLSHHSYAQIYQWTDEHGNAQFSDEPPKQGSYKTSDISNSPRSSSSPSLNNNDIKLRQQKQNEVFEQERIEKEKKQQELAQQQLQLQNECLRAKDYLEMIKSAQIYDLDTNGERVYKSEQERANEIKRVDQAIKRHCPP